MVKDTIIKFIKIQNELGILDLFAGLDQDFDKRRLIQKMFYFLIKLGFNLKLKYNFYKYGPYSPNLADIYYESFEIAKAQIDVISDYNFSNQDRIALENLKGLFRKWGNNIKKWEYFSSLLYIHEDMYFQNWNIQNVISTITRKKPFLFDIYKLDNPLQELKNLGLLKKG